jgi:predicted N-acetyltransferase YhbS
MNRNPKVSGDTHILPAYRDMQIGTELVRHALHQAREQGWKSVFVYGQPDYYCRFGFKSQAADGADSPSGRRMMRHDRHLTVSTASSMVPTM